MKIRNILYGYQYQNGTIVIHPEEIKVIKRIFNEYLSGQSLLQIADILNDEHIEYMPGVYGWNKSRIKRLIEDERYLGAKSYPPIIDEGTHKTLIQIKSEKNTQKHIDRKSDIFNLGVPTVCPNCNGEMVRRHDACRKAKDWWRCETCRTAINIDNSDLLSRITELLNTVIENPEMIQISDTNTEIKSCTDVMRIQNEINRELEKTEFNKDMLIQNMFKCVSLKYRNIDSNQYISEKLKADFANASPLSVFSMDLFSCTVKTINLSSNGTASIVLMNNQQIGKEQSNDTIRGNATEIRTHNTCTG